MQQRNSIQNSSTRHPKRIGIFGGSFDPPHMGHLIIAERATDQLRLDVTFFVPAFLPPHKLRRKTTPPEQRLAMLRRAIRGNRRFRISELELRRKGISFTVDTLRTMKRRFPKSTLYLIIGSDNLELFETWKEPEHILKLARLVVYPRRTSPRTGRVTRTLRLIQLKGPILDISSSDLRRLVRTGASIRYLVPHDVELYIASHRLYRNR
jgi:nicotinate-nucleotide adenylyltransferase